MDSHECVTTESKVCKTCKEIKPFNAFGLGRNKKPAPQCKDCKNAYSREHYRKNAERIIVKTQDYKKRNPEKYAKMLADWYIKNREHVLSRSFEYRNKPEVKAKELARQRIYYNERKVEIQAKRKAILDNDSDKKQRYREISKSHYRANKHMYYEKYVRRKRAIVKATPPWANINAIREIYKESISKSLELGVRYVVDHFIPLNSKLVCGLHVENNLRIILELDNLQKANKLIEG